MDWLSAHQCQDGGWTTYSSADVRMTQPLPYDTSVYTTTFALHALVLCRRPDLSVVIERAGAFLRREREHDGVWNYEGRGGLRLPPDLDDTSCAVAALRGVGDMPELSFYAHLWRNEVAPGGPYFTWVGVNDLVGSSLCREVDFMVNANIAFCCGALGLDTPGIVRYLSDAVVGQAAASKYSVSPHFLLYLLTRAYAHGPVPGLASVMPVVKHFILTQLRHPGDEVSAFNVACLVASLLNAEAPMATVDPYLRVLLERQSADGSWPMCAAYVSFDGRYDGSAAMTTAIALDAVVQATDRA